jgi:hypothetical protein
MPSLTLPPRGVFVPTALVYATDLSPTAFHTWVQLRGLAWQGGQTPPCTVQDLSQLTGKSPSALYGHLAVLKACGALRWRSAGKGILTIVFDAPEEQADLPVGIGAPAALRQASQPTYGDHNGEPALTDLDSRSGDSRIPESRLLESGQTSSPSLKSLNLHTQESDREEGKLQDSGIQDLRTPESEKKAANAAAEPILSDAVVSDAIATDIIAIYRELTSRRPNQSQRAELLQQVTDPGLWRRTLAHWQVHGWNPGNFAGLLDLYRRGGPEACRYCARKDAPSRHDPIDELIAELQKEAKHVRPRRDRPHPENPG